MHTERWVTPSSETSLIVLKKVLEQLGLGFASAADQRLVHWIIFDLAHWPNEAEGLYLSYDPFSVCAGSRFSYQLQSDLEYLRDYFDTDTRTVVLVQDVQEHLIRYGQQRLQEAIKLHSG